MNQNNRKFQYGDGFFETLIVEKGDIRFWNDHFNRIKFACKTLQLEIPPSFKESLEKEILRKSTFSNSRVKIQFWRSGDGKYTPENNNLSFHVEVTENSTPFFRQAAKIDICSTSEVIPSKYSSFKCFLLPYIIAAIEKEEKRVDDLIILNTGNKITECISSNLFWANNNQFYTPSLKTGCLNGIMRTQILKKIEIKEVETELKDIEVATNIFCTNATGITQFESFMGRKLELLDLESLFQKL